MTKWTCPLQWEGDGDYEMAKSPFGYYSCEKTNGGYTVNYCFTEFYDEGSEVFETKKEAKVWAQGDWDYRLAPIFENMEKKK